KWIPASRGLKTSERTFLAKLVRGTQALQLILRQRVRNLRNNDISLWPLLETEQPYWIMYPGIRLDYQYINLPAFTETAPGIIPYVNQGLRLSKPGILVSDGSSAGTSYFINLPRPQVTEEAFWSQGSCPRVWADAPYVYA